MKRSLSKQFGLKLSVTLLFLSGIFTVFGASGDVDTSFNASILSSFGGNVARVKIQPDGKILAAGSFRAANGSAEHLLPDSTPTERSILHLILPIFMLRRAIFRVF